MASETGEQQLAKLRRQMARALRGGDTTEYERLAAAYADLKAQEVDRVHREQREAARARAAARRAVEAQQAERWRLPPGFRSPLAMARARSGIRPREEPPGPGPGGLRPWRRGWSPLSQQIWRPPS